MKMAIRNISILKACEDMNSKGIEMYANELSYACEYEYSTCESKYRIVHILLRSQKMKL